MQYKTINPGDVAAFQKILDTRRVIIGQEISEDFSHDEMGEFRKSPDVLLQPVSTDEVSQVIAYAFQHDIPVTPRGQGTGLVGGAVAIEGGILLDLSLMNRILELDEDNLLLTVEPGVILLNLYQFVESKGLFYPPNPGEKSASIGGNISTNAGGMSAVKYGVTRDYIKGLEVVLPNGHVVRLGGKLMKNTSGYDLKELFIGSEGTLGIVTQIILKLLPLPSFNLSVLVPFPSLDKAIGCVPEIIKSKVIPRSIEFMEKEVILMAEEYLGKKFPDHSAPAYLLLAFDGSSREQVEKEMEVAAEVCLEQEAIDVLIADTEERTSMLWSARGAFLEAIKNSTSEIDECDVVIPRNCISRFIKFTKDLAANHQVRIFSFGHAGDGNLHIYILRDDLNQEDWEGKKEKVFDRMYAFADELGGAISGEHGIGFAKKKYLNRVIHPDARGMMLGIKQLIDPKMILNPGKIVDSSL